MRCNHPSTRRTKRTWAKTPGSPGPRGLTTSEMIHSEAVNSPALAAFGADIEKTLQFLRKEATGRPIRRTE